MCKEVAIYIGSDHKRHRHIGRHIEPMGFELHKAVNIFEAKKLSKKTSYRLVLIHPEIVDSEVFEFCSFVRSGNACAILIALVGEVGAEIEERLFDCGVNDVVAGKQIAACTLARRIRAHLHYCKSPWQQANRIRLKDTLVDFDRRDVWCNGSSHKLCGILGDLLKYFLNNPNRVISRDELLESSIWSDSICSSAEDGGKTFDVNVGKLRKAIEPDPANPEIIITVRGVGWKLAEGTV